MILKIRRRNGLSYGKRSSINLKETGEVKSKLSERQKRILRKAECAKHKSCRELCFYILKRTTSGNVLKNGKRSAQIKEEDDQKEVEGRGIRRNWKSLMRMRTSVFLRLISDEGKGV